MEKDWKSTKTLTFIKTLLKAFIFEGEEKMKLHFCFRCEKKSPNDCSTVRGQLGSVDVKECDAVKTLLQRKANKLTNKKNNWTRTPKNEYLCCGVRFYGLGLNLLLE